MLDLIELDLPFGYKESDLEVVERMINSLYFRYSINKKGTSLPFWMDQFSSQNEANKAIIRLAKLGLIKTSVAYNYATIELNPKYMENKYSPEELVKFKRDCKQDFYMLSTDKTNKVFGNKTKTSNGKVHTGLHRPGMAKCSNNAFSYDIDAMIEYRDEIVKFSIKSMEKMEEVLGYSLEDIDRLDYKSIIEDTIDNIIAANGTYYLGELVLDSRGRAIYKCLEKIFNPISNKMARSLIKVEPYEVTEKQLDDAYLFIAELVSGFDGDIDRKLQNGKQYYKDSVYHEVDPNSDDYLDNVLHNIWLERLYVDIEEWSEDNTHKFTTPIEVDFSSSNLVIIGLLLGHSDYIDHTTYMWQIEGLTKEHVKKAQTPYVFGSKAPVTKLWENANLKWNSDQLKLMLYHQSHGKFAIANELKDIIIDHCHPTESIRLNVNGEKFTVYCNKHNIVADTTKQYVIYNTDTNRLEVINNTSTIKIPDLYRFKTYFVTGLIHNLDSQVMDNMCKHIDWALPIHDAGIVRVSEARKFKNLAVTEMHKLLANGRSILLDYAKSINMDNEGLAKLVKLIEKVKKINKDKEINITPYLLK